MSEQVRDLALLCMVDEEGDGHEIPRANGFVTYSMMVYPRWTRAKYETS